MSEHKTKKAHAHKGHGEHGKLPFVRAGGMLLNLGQVVKVDLPTEGDATKPLTLTTVSGGVLTLTGDDADAVLACLGDCCDVT